MNTQSAESEERSLRYSRDEYIKLARESCMKNFYGDQMKSRDTLLKEAEEKKRQNALEQGNQHSVVIPFEEGRLSRSERNRHAAEKIADQSNTSYGERMNADIINRKLAIHKEESQDTARLPSLDLMEVGPSEDLIPTSADILKMSGVEETIPEPVNNHYTEEYADSYVRPDNSNFLTSIRNAEPEQEEKEKPEKKAQDPEEAKAFRWFVVRCICAFVILAAVIVLDKIKFDYKGIEAESIYEKIVSTELVDQVEEWLQAEAAK